MLVRSWLEIVNLQGQHHNRCLINVRVKPKPYAPSQILLHTPLSTADMFHNRFRNAYHCLEEHRDKTVSRFIVDDQSGLPQLDARFFEIMPGGWIIASKSVTQMPS